MSQEKNLWSGLKTEKLQIRLTEAEKADLEQTCEEKGGMGLGRYLMNLHHKAMGRLGSSKGDAE